MIARNDVNDSVVCECLFGEAKHKQANAGIVYDNDVNASVVRECLFGEAKHEEANAGSVYDRDNSVLEGLSCEV